MIILGLDPAQNTGWALFDTSKPTMAIETGSFRAQGASHEHKAYDLGQKFHAFLKNHRVDMVVMEAPPKQAFQASQPKKFMGQADQSVQSTTGLNAVISGNEMAGALLAIMGAYGLLCETIAPVSWRKATYGFGREKGWTRKDWKRKAREVCRMEKISARNDDEAEAAMIAIAGRATDTFKGISQGVLV